MLLPLLEPSPENDVPQLGADSEAGLFSAEVVLVVVFLQLVEVAALGLGGIDVMQRVVTGIVGGVAEVEEGPEDGRNERVVEAHHPAHCEIAEGDYDDEERRR